MNQVRIDAETMVIASIIQEPRKLIELQQLSKDHFSDKSCRIVFIAAKRYHERQALRGRSQYAPLAGIERELDKLLAKTDDPIKTKARKHARRAASNLLDEIANSDAIGQHEFRDAINQVIDGWLDEQTRSILLELADEIETKGTDGIHQKLQAASSKLAPAATGTDIERLDLNARAILIDYEKAKNNKQGTKIETFDPTLNKVTSGGGKKGRLWIVAAYAKGGKTQGAKELIYHAAKQGRNCVIVTSEQTSSDVRLMLACRHSHNFKSGGLNYNAIEEGKLSAKDEAILRATVNDLRTNSVMGKISYFKTAHGTTIGEVRSMLESVNERTPIDLVMIDHTGLFAPTKRRDSASASAAAVMMEIKDLALNFGREGLWVIACHQISRDGFEKAEKRGGYYIPADMANTAEAERSCDLMLYLYRDQELADTSEIRMGVALDRYGPGEIKGWNLFEHFSSSAILPISSGP